MLPRGGKSILVSLNKFMQIMYKFNFIFLTVVLGCFFVNKVFDEFRLTVVRMRVAILITNGYKCYGFGTWNTTFSS